MIDCWKLGPQKADRTAVSLSLSLWLPPPACVQVGFLTVSFLALPGFTGMNKQTLLEPNGLQCSLQPPRPWPTPYAK